MTRDFVLSAAQKWTLLAIYLLTALNSPSLDLKLTSLHFQPYNSYHLISENLVLTRNPLVGIFFLYIIFALKFFDALGGNSFLSFLWNCLKGQPWTRWKSDRFIGSNQWLNRPGQLLCCGPHATDEWDLTIIHAFTSDEST